MSEHYRAPMPEANLPSGITLIQLLGRDPAMSCISWACEGRMLAAASANSLIHRWDVQSGKKLSDLVGHAGAVGTLLASPSGDRLVSGSNDSTLKIWDAETGRQIHSLIGQKGPILSIAWSPDCRLLAACLITGEIRLWNTADATPKLTLAASGQVLAWSPDGSVLASGSRDGVVRLWDAVTGELRHKLTEHREGISCLAWSPDGLQLATGSTDATIRIWNKPDGKLLRVLEGHTKQINSLAWDPSGRILASSSWDRTLRLWRTDRWNPIALVHEFFRSLSFHPGKSILAAVQYDKIQVLQLNTDILLDTTSNLVSVQYASAKVVLVGDVGVGKSGLWRVLTGQPFVPTDSTHGRHVQRFENVSIDLGNDQNELRETFIWDLAGQPGYRLIHQLHLNQVSVAVLVVDARSETDPFSGVRHWDRALRQALHLQGASAGTMRKILVVARIDRGGLPVSAARLDAFKRELAFDSVFETSAKEGWNIPELSQAISHGIDWENLPKVTSDKLFHEIRLFLIAEKESGRILTTAENLEENLLRSFEQSDTKEISAAHLRNEFATCLRLAEGRDILRRLSFGNLMLLQPELLDAYASAIVNAARQEPDGMGSIKEKTALSCDFRMSSDERIPNREQEKLLLMATVEDLLRHEIALRESSDSGSYLIFPSQLTRENPELPDPQGKELAICFSGPILNIYATLAVRLSYSGIFEKKEMWKNAVVYTAHTGGSFGIALKELEEGRAELSLFFDDIAPRELRTYFENYVLEHISARALPDSTVRTRIYRCDRCGEGISVKAAEARRSKGFDWILCNVCDEHRVALVDREQLSLESPGIRKLNAAVDQARNREVAITSAVAEISGKKFGEWVGSAEANLVLVFTDIVGATALAEELGDESMDDVRRAHFERARLCAKHKEGYYVKDMGDGVLAAFKAETNALDFALELCMDRGSELIQIRVGMHVGPVTIEEGDAFGNIVNISARIQGVASESGIWISDDILRHLSLRKAHRHAHLNWVEHSNIKLKGSQHTYTLWSISPKQKLRVK